MTSPKSKRRRAGETPTHCTVAGCQQPHAARDLCAKHYQKTWHQQRVAADPKVLEAFKARKRKRTENPTARAIDSFCNMRNKLRQNFGVTFEVYCAMLVAQNHGCAICGGVDEGKNLAVDHCHATGQIRGLLCQNCNHAIGKFKDSPALLRAAAAYLERE